MNSFQYGAGWKRQLQGRREREEKLKPEGKVEEREKGKRGKVKVVRRRCDEGGREKKEKKDKQQKTKRKK